MTAKPEIEPTASGFQFLWDEQGISINVSRVRIGQDSSVNGEIIILNHSKTIYPPTKLNFTSERTRTSLVKTLTERENKIPWDIIIDQLCYGIQDRVRRGEPLKELNTSDDIEAPRYLLEPLIIENYPNILFGDPSAFKSNLAVMLVQILQLPWHDNPFNLQAPASPVKCAYLDWETDEMTIQWLNKLLEKSYDLGMLSIKYRHCEMPLVDDIDAIRQHIIDCQAEVTIIDSLGLAAGGELKETKSPLDFYRALRQLRTTPFILAHNSKDREAKTRTVYGNQFFQAQARNVWEIRRIQEEGSSELDIALFHRKPPPFKGMHAPLGYHITFNSVTGLYQVKQSAATLQEFKEQLSVSSQIMATLKNGAYSVDELAEELDIKEGTIRVGITRLKAKNKITKVGKKYGLVGEDFGDEEEVEE